MKIAFISTILAYPWGGADTLWTRSAEAAAERGDSLLLAVSAVVLENPRVVALRAGGARVVERRAPAIPGLGEKIARRLGWGGVDPLVPALEEFRPDLVVFSCGGTYDMVVEDAACAWLERSGTAYRVIANWQSENPELKDADRLNAARLLGRAEAVFFVSHRNLAVTRRHLLDPLPRARVVQNPLRWTPADRPPWPGDDVRGLATVGRLEHGKGAHLLLHAAAEALPRDAAWRIDLFGLGAAGPYLRDTAARLDLTSRLRFRGHVSKLADIWAENELMVSASLDDGVPMTIPEAMLCGRPVLATAVGGAEDWIESGRTGFLCPAATVPLLAEALRGAWARRADWRAMGAEAAAAALARYRPDDYREIIRPLQ